MIDKIFFDLDETLIHSSSYNNEGVSFEINLANEFWGDEHYYVFVNPCAHRLLEYARDLVGADNVFILTTSIEDYAKMINKKANFEFRDDQILHRGLISHKLSVGEYLHDTKNVLIDNLPNWDNLNKCKLLGIDRDRYIQVPAFYGREIFGFEEDIKAEIDYIEKHGKKEASAASGD